VFNLHLLSWRHRDGDTHKITAPLLTDLEAGKLAPVVAEISLFSRAGEANRFLAERRNIGEVVLTPGCLRPVP
jgi:NADPH:quinone reductase-like Zn-dependent oxidoreductase